MATDRTNPHYIRTRKLLDSLVITAGAERLRGHMAEADDIIDEAADTFYEAVFGNISNLQGGGNTDAEQQKGGSQS